MTKVNQQQPRKRERNSEKIRSKSIGTASNAPRIMKEVQQEEKTQTDERIAVCFERLDELGKVELFLFAFNPNSFSQTVENLFDISFLIRQNRAGFTIDNSFNPPKLFVGMFYLCSFVSNLIFRSQRSS
jgi:hypothetical protein